MTKGFASTSFIFSRCTDVRKHDEPSNVFAAGQRGIRGMAQWPLGEADRRNCRSACGSLRFFRNRTCGFRMANTTGDATGVIASTPVEIGARRSDDRRSRVLRNHQPAEG